MERLIIGCLLIAGLVTAGCTTTNTTGKTKDLNRFTKKEIAAYNANPENRDKIVCITEKPVGSIIPEKNCHKESKIRERQEQDQQAMREYLGTTAPIPSK